MQLHSTAQPPPRLLKGMGSLWISQIFSLSCMGGTGLIVLSLDVKKFHLDVTQDQRVTLKACFTSFFSLIYLFIEGGGRMLSEFTGLTCSEEQRRFIIE